MSHFTRADCSSGLSRNVATGGVPSDARGDNHVVVYATTLADTVATAIATVTIPNIGCSGFIMVDYVSYFDASTTLNDSARTAGYRIAFTRKVGVAAVATASAVITGSTAIATSSGGATLTTALTLGSITGGATVAETFTILVANTASAGSPTSSVLAFISIVQSGITGATVAGANA